LSGTLADLCARCTQLALPELHVATYCWIKVAPLAGPEKARAADAHLKRFAQSGISFRLDVLRAETRRSRHLVNVTIGLLPPAAFPIWMAGEGPYKEWLLAETLRCWEEAVLATGSPSAGDLLARTRAWVRDETQWVHHYDAPGKWSPRPNPPAEEDVLIQPCLEYIHDVTLQAGPNPSLEETDDDGNQTGRL
jgi:hypothetical protein